MPQHEVKRVMGIIEKEFRLPQLSVILFPKVEEPEEHKKTAIPELKDIKEVAPVEKKEDMKPSETKIFKEYNCGKGRGVL